jgi:Na+/H+ antiporter NhaD/arsenite permease-like protein
MLGALVNTGVIERVSRFWEFTRYGLIVTVLTVALAMPYLYLRYFALA